MSNIVLIGFMGVGKTTIGNRLGKLLKMKFVDMDRQIEREQDKKISDIFAQQGEPFFRDLETRMLRSLTASENIILSTGGGIVLRPENRELMKRIGTVVLLEGSVNTVYKRVRLNKNRPILKHKNSKQQIAKLMRERKNFYHLSADLRVSINHKTVMMICEEIVEKIHKGEEDV